MPKALWGGRFKKDIDDRLKRFSYSLRVDHELLCAELCVNEAYIKMLGKMGVLKAGEVQKLKAGLKAIGKNWKHSDICRLHEEFEDIHTYVQNQLEKKIGAAAKKIHTGRSRNDLVVTSTRFYLKGRLKQLDIEMSELQRALLSLARKAGEAVIPGLTHLKKAQPVLIAHHLLAYIEMIEEDRERLRDAFKRTDVLVLGSAALAGSSLPIDQKFLAKELKFSRISTNSLAAVSDRSFMTEILSDLSIFWMHLSRLAEDFILWNSEAFHYIELDDGFATGSSLMPQKKNPDLFELLRGRSSIIFGELMAHLALQKGLALSYNRDLQEDKPGLFRALRLTHAALEVLPPALKSVTFNPKAMAKAIADDGLYATDLLEYLVRKGVAFSEAHRLVGQVVRTAADSEKPMREFTIRTWKEFSNHFEADIYDLFNPHASVSAKRTIGSTNPSKVRSEILRWDKYLRTI